MKTILFGSYPDKEVNEHHSETRLYGQKGAVGLGQKGSRWKNKSINQV
jgi:hypothetical protein